MELKKVSIKRFKQFVDEQIELREGLTIVAGGNNAGKSSLLQALAVWEFCKIATVAEKGSVALTAEGRPLQGLGIGDDQFSPINVPTLNHLWTNLKSSKNPEKDPDGYTLSICCLWTDDEAAEKYLKFSLSLANDRLFVKVSDSNLNLGDRTPTIAYLPPFAGITAHEERATGAMRRRRVGEGVAGAVLRNLLLDMKESNQRKRAKLSAGKTRVPERDLVTLREEDPWELPQSTLREIFATEIVISDFNPEYHSYIQVNVAKGSFDGTKFARYAGFKPRDLMMEGSGFLQWLSVYTLATSPSTDVLLLDEPDAHLHAALQAELVDRLGALSAKFHKQVLMATHSTEIIRSAPAFQVMEVRRGQTPRVRQLADDSQKIQLMAGIGTTYAPRIDKVARTKKVFFYEGTSDASILEAFSGVLGKAWPDHIALWQTSDTAKFRKNIWLALCREFGDVRALSLRDRDDEHVNTVGEGLRDAGGSNDDGFLALKWRRRYIESYLIWPDAIASASGRSVDVIKSALDKDFGLGTIGENWTKAQPASAFIDAKGKEILKYFGVNPVEVAKRIPKEAVCDDVKTLLDELSRLVSG